MVTIQKYVRAQSLEEAYQLNQVKTNRIIGGMLWLKMGSGNINTAIDLCDLGLNKIEENDEQFSIGASVTLRQLELHPGLNTYSNNAVSNAVKDIVGVQFRNLATIGGSIWGRFGFSDVLTCFMAMDCYVELFNAGIIPISEFAYMKYDKDLLVRIIVKKTPGTFHYSSMRAQRTDFPIIACALSCINGKYKAVIGSRPHRAMFVTDEENILKDGITEETAESFAKYVAKNIRTGSNSRGSASYRKQLIEVLTKRGILSMKEGDEK